MTTEALISETLTTRGDTHGCALTIAVPTYRDDPSELIETLAKCERAESTYLLIYDDGSGDETLSEKCRQLVRTWPGAATLISGAENRGRSHARNRLVSHSATDWILFLDADMLPDHKDFLVKYFTAIGEQTGEALIAGGFSLDKIKPSAAQSLHAAQSLASECLPASERACEPGRYVFTSNILVHKDILLTVHFDNEFSGWGWEDVDWGLRVADLYLVVHIDNTATHLGLDDTNTLLSKYGASGPNFARMVSRHPEAALKMKLVRAARKLTKFPGRAFIALVSKWAARSRLPNSLRLKALKLYRAATYAEHLR